MTTALPMGKGESDKQGKISGPTAIETVAELRAMAAQGDWTGFVQWLVECPEDDDIKRAARRLLRNVLAMAGRQNGR